MFLCTPAVFSSKLLERSCSYLSSCSDEAEACDDGLFPSVYSSSLPSSNVCLTLSKNFPHPPPPKQPVACSAVLGHKPHFPWRTITLALGFALSGASPGAWHAVVHCCKQKHTYIESIPSSAVPDGCSQVQINSCSWEIQSHSRERGQAVTGALPLASV